MLKILLRFLLTAALTYGLSMMLPGVVLRDFTSAAILVIVLGLLNATVKPILKFIGFPLTVLSLGLFLLVINIIIIKLAVLIVPGFRVDGWLNALILSLALALASSVVDMLVSDNDK